MVGAVPHCLADRKQEIGVPALSWLLEAFLLLCDKEYSELGLSANQAADSHQTPNSFPC